MFELRKIKGLEAYDHLRILETDYIFYAKRGRNISSSKGEIDISDEEYYTQLYICIDI